MTWACCWNKINFKSLGIIVPKSFIQKSLAIHHERCSRSAGIASTNPFENKINLRTKEGISVWKTATNPDKSLGYIALTVKNGNKFLARMKSKCSEFWLNKFNPILTTGNGVPEKLIGVPGTVSANTEIFCITTTNSMKIKLPCYPDITRVAKMCNASIWILLLQYLRIFPQWTWNFSVWRRNKNIAFSPRWYFKLSRITPSTILPPVDLSVTRK